MGGADLVPDALPPVFDELELLRIAEPQLVQPLGLSLAHVPGRGLRVGVSILVVMPQGVPVLVAGALHGVADVVAGEGHARKLLLLTAPATPHAGDPTCRYDAECRTLIPTGRAVRGGFSGSRDRRCAGRPRARSRPAAPGAATRH